MQQQKATRVRKPSFRAMFMEAVKRAKEEGRGTYYVVGFLEVDFPKESEALKDLLDATLGSGRF